LHKRIVRIAYIVTAAYRETAAYIVDIQTTYNRMEEA
jgi:hypothetical protein